LRKYHQIHNTAHQSFVKYLSVSVKFISFLHLRSNSSIQMENSVSLNAADGTTMAAYAAYPPNGAKNAPALLLFQEAFGVNDHIRRVADKFAADGFVVIATELFHRTASAGWTADYNDFQSVMPHYQALTNEGMQADIQTSFDWLLSQGVDKSRIHSIGYCLGGRVSFLANATVPVKSAVSYYGGSMDQITDMAAQLHGKHLFFWGGKDQHIKPENINKVIDAMDAAGKAYINMKISYADHGFNCDARPMYNPVAAKEALALTLAFLNE
jgi:carboxymethylenebutenolidase